MPKILVTGSRGTIGKLLVLELRRRGHQVHGIDLFHCPDPPEEYLRADVGDWRQLERVFADDYDYVYHLGAEFGRQNGEAYFEQVWRANVIGTRNILEWQVRRGFRLIIASSSEIYGDLGEMLLEEGLADRLALHQTNDYAITKWVNELQARNFAILNGSEIVRVRIFNSYGPGEGYHPYRSVVCLFCHHALVNHPFQVFRSYYRTFMFLDDLLPSLARIVDNFNPGAVYNLGGRDHRSVEELAAIVLKVTGADPGLVVPCERDYPNAIDKYPDISLAIRDLGHDPRIRLEEGVPLTVAWMRQRIADACRT